MWDSFRNQIITGAAALLLTGIVWVANEARVLPVIQKQREIDNLYNKRDRLLDRIEDGIITDYQRGILSGLCTALDIPQAECENRRNK